jgi:opacity protein-like surface antigen
MVTCGVTFILSKSITFDAAYAYSHYATETTDIDWRNVLSEEYSTHRGTATVSIRY